MDEHLETSVPGIFAAGGIARWLDRLTAERWDKAEPDGQLDADTRDGTITYRRGGKTLAVATVYRDMESLRAEV